uniref:Uncharacterized protein n=1 Tax=Caenorhabditis japonica TaxID=281687 RepID=A0A8R1E2Z5_CAEJA
MNRIGLQQLNASARNSNNAFIENHHKICAEPPILTKTFKKFQSASLANASVPENISREENVYIKESQTIQHHPSSTQTDISTTHRAPLITLEDLCSEQPTAQFLKALANRLHEELAEEIIRNSQLVEELCQVEEEIQKLEEDTELLLDVLHDIDEEQKAHEEGVSHL